MNIYYRHWTDRLTAVPDPSLPSRSPPSLTTHLTRGPYINEAHIGSGHILSSDPATLPVLNPASSSSGVENSTYNQTELSPVPLRHRRRCQR